MYHGAPWVVPAVYGGFESKRFCADANVTRQETARRSIFRDVLGSNFAHRSWSWRTFFGDLNLPSSLRSHTTTFPSMPAVAEALRGDVTAAHAEQQPQTRIERFKCIDSSSKTHLQ